MIKFFRKIRQNLLVENKFRKYLLYAIGEILLIVIGLFIAIQLNNINQNKEVHKKQIRHLENIRSEMINNLNSMHKIDDLSLEIMDAERKIITYIDLGVVSESKMTEQLRVVTFNELIVPFENGALNEIISSGGLKDIKNENIRSMLASWEGKTTALKSQEIQLADIRNAIIAFCNDEGSIRILNDKRRQDLLNIDAPQKKLSNLPLLKLRPFENTILHHLMLTYYLRNTIFPELENVITDLITLIDIELSKS